MARIATILFLSLIASAPALACGPYGSFTPWMTAHDDDRGLFAEAIGNTVTVSNGKTTTTVDVEATSITAVAFDKQGALVVTAVDGESTQRITYALVN